MSMTLTVAGYESLHHPSICSSDGKGSLLSLDIVEERPVVRIGIRGTIVAIKRTRASFGAIVRIAESAKGTKTGGQGVLPVTFR